LGNSNKMLFWLKHNRWIGFNASLLQQLPFYIIEFVTFLPKFNYLRSFSNKTKDLVTSDLVSQVCENVHLTKQELKQLLYAWLNKMKSIQRVRSLRSALRFFQNPACSHNKFICCDVIGERHSHHWRALTGVYTQSFFNQLPRSTWQHHQIKSSSGCLKRQLNLRCSAEKCFIV